MSATNQRRAIPEILDAMKTAIKATQWNEEPAFERVELFDNNSIEDAMKDEIRRRQAEIRRQQFEMRRIANEARRAAHQDRRRPKP